MRAEASDSKEQEAQAAAGELCAPVPLPLFFACSPSVCLTFGSRLHEARRNDLDRAFLVTAAGAGVHG